MLKHIIFTIYRDDIFNGINHTNYHITDYTRTNKLSQFPKELRIFYPANCHHFDATMLFLDKAITNEPKQFLIFCVLLMKSGYTRKCRNILQIKSKKVNKGIEMSANTCINMSAKKFLSTIQYNLAVSLEFSSELGIKYIHLMRSTRMGIKD